MHLILMASTQLLQPIFISVTKDLLVTLHTMLRLALDSSIAMLLTKPRLKSLVELVFPWLLPSNLDSMAKSLLSLVRIHLTMKSLTGVPKSVLSTPSENKSDNSFKGPFTGPFFYGTIYHSL